VLVFPILFFAFFVQTVTGFGSAMLAMPLLAGLIGIRTATPLFAMSAMIVQIVVWIRYREAFQLRSVWQLMVGAVVGIPLGVLALSAVPENIILTALGVLVLGYALYALLGPELPEIKHRERLGLTLGFFSGLLSGAYNTGGPPFVIYGTASRWKPLEFKSNLQALFIVTEVVVIASHALKGNLTPTVFEYFLLTLPAAGLGIVAGFGLDRFLKPDLFRKIVLVLLVLLGISLILG